MEMTLNVCFLSAPTLSGWRKSLPSSPVCLTAFAPGTTAPSTAVVRNIRLPHTIGDECERPSIAVFHFMFLVGVHSDGRFFSFEIPEPSGPRHCGQFPGAASLGRELRQTATNAIATLSVNAIVFTLIVSLVFWATVFIWASFYCSLWELLQTHTDSTLCARSRAHPKAPVSP